MMRVVVCVRQGLDGELGPFDASAYEMALSLADAEVTLLSMGPATASEWLLRLTRLGAQKAILLSDKALAGADTLATAYALSLAVGRLAPDLVLCGRQTLIGDTAQTGPMLAELAGFDLATGVMGIRALGDGRALLDTREGEAEVALPALLTVEKVGTLRLPRLRSRVGEVEVWNAAALGADVARCGLGGSPTRVVKTFENQTGKRKCQWISMYELDRVIREGLGKQTPLADSEQSGERLARVCIVGESPRGFAELVSDDIVLLPLTDASELAERITALSPSAVLWASDSASKQLAARVAARLRLGLCADCTSLAVEGGELMMIRPALSGSVIAKIRSMTLPAMATVRTESGSVSDVIVGVGMGVKDDLGRVRVFAERYGAELCASRRLVDNGYATYDMQVGLTGKVVSPPVYVAVGISGAVHHIAGMQRAGTVIAINPDKNAPIFDYADYGIVAEF